jgi:Tol biopolymer transport system component
MDADSGRVTDSLARITNNAATDYWPSVTEDGTKVLFSSSRSGKTAFWLHDLENGSETELATTGAVWPATGAIEKNGNSFLYYSETRRAVERVDISTGNVAAVWPCGKCMYMGRTADRSMFLHGPDGQIKLREIDSGRDIEFLKHPGRSLHQAQASNDGRWVVFYARTGVERSQIFIAPLRKGPPPAETDWIRVTEGNAHELCPSWSPDGTFIYFGSNRDGFNCIWGQRLHPHSKRPVGPAVDLAHFHTAARRLGNVGVAFRGLSVARDKLVFTMEERIGNIWFMR